MKYGERLTLTIEEMDEKGRGCGPVSNKTGCVRGVVTGETVEAEFVGRDKGRLKLANPKILSPSADRVSPECPHYGVCGGCSLQHASYGRQVEMKRDLVNRTLASCGLKLGSIVPSKTIFRHRNRMDYVFGPDGELGLKESGRWDKVVDLATCLMLSEDSVEVLRRVKAWAKTTGRPYWDNVRHAGYFRYLVIREGKATGERMATLVTSPGELPDAESLIAAIAPLCTTIYHGINPRLTDLSISDELHLLHGKPELHEQVGGITFAINPNSFFQTNTEQAGVLLEHVRALVMSGEHGKLLDLYCGSGFFSLALAKDVNAALGVELDSAAIESARKNAEANSIGNVSYRAEAAEALSWSTERPDVVIVDPPRSGLHPKVRRTLLQHLPPRIVYVSCSPKALAVDLKDLLRSYDAEPPTAIDLFPQTPHIETLVHLQVKG